MQENKRVFDTPMISERFLTKTTISGVEKNLFFTIYRLCLFSIGLLEKQTAVIIENI